MLISVCFQKISVSIKELEENNNLLEESVTFSLPTSPVPIMQEDDYLSVSSSSSQLQEQVDQLEFDRDEMEAKYEEIKVCLTELL